MTLGEKQRVFVPLLAKLIVYAYDSGYELTLGEAYRTPEQAIRNAVNGSGIINTLHAKRLAIDLNLFKNGSYLTDTESHRPLGTYWKSLHTLARWGGDFGDGNHYSIEHEGIR